ncbi:hypothetical protein [Gordoniibacillus kamchatkensis]|uniref:hypothetical protein n=1 Tax=Gordoniibacillus kamchatkensis TaxID=1590651 RepID=UPI000B283F40|nr:hypothetical protein [Paenibacillus sp. VKM B-2647]
MLYLFLFAGILFSFVGCITCLEIATNESAPLVVRQISKSIAVAMGIVLAICVFGASI